MIFATVGAQMPFDRLIQALDVWAAENPDVDIFAQIGDTTFTPQHMPFVKWMAPEAFEPAFAEADLVVAHAGMGTIITALELHKPLLVMPRRGELGETRNDHQVATARRLSEMGVVQAAMNEQELGGCLSRMRAARPVPAGAAGCWHRHDSCPYPDEQKCDHVRPGTACWHLVGALQDFLAGKNGYANKKPVHLPGRGG
jgi:UDP-N-acetylglucosamine transferase subunit ALG13